MGLISSRSMTPEQRSRCCLNDLSPEVIGYVLSTRDGRRIGTVDDILMDDESFTLRFLIVNTSTAEFMVNQPYVMLAAELCCWDAEHKSVRADVTVGQVQDAPAYERAVALVQAIEDTAIFRFGERPSGPADH